VIGQYLAALLWLLEQMGAAYALPAEHPDNESCAWRA
jgi:hypothetical protein